MIITSNRAKAFLAKPDKKIWCALVFGPDTGEVTDLSAGLIKSWSDDTAELQTMDEDAVRKSPIDFFDALEATSLLGNRRIIRLRTSGDKIAKHLVEAIKLGDTRAPDAKLIILADGLRKTSKLRKAAEAAEGTATLQAAAATMDPIADIFDAALKSGNIDITTDARDGFLAAIPAERLIAKQEIEKLVLFAHDLGRAVTLDDVTALASSMEDKSLAQLCDAMFAQNLKAVRASLESLEITGTSPISILRAVQFQLSRILNAQSMIAEGHPSPGSKLRPPVWDRDWPAFRKRLKVWPTRRLISAIAQIYDAEAQAKASGAAAMPVVRKLIMDFAKA